MKRPVFILGAHKSGTSLLRSLFDGHPDFFVLPLETHPFQLSGHWVDYRFRKSRPPILSLQESKERFIQWIDRYNSVSDALADGDLTNRLELSLFKEAMSMDAGSFKELIEQYFRSIYKALYRRDMPEGLRIVEKSVEHAEFAIELRSMFPDSTFIHILRNPYSNLVAIRRYISRSRKYLYPYLGNALLALYNSYYALEKNSRILDKYWLVRYEDILQNPANTLCSLADSLGITYTDALIQPTVLGKAWVGNSSRGIQFSGISTHNLEAWKKEITHLEVFYINQLFDFILRKYNYEQIDPKYNWLLPVRWETPRTYLFNRAALRFLK
jgi:protein-tyrosine sulfotransferase